MHPIQQLEIFRDSVTNYKKYLLKNLNNDSAEEIGDWFDCHFINKVDQHKISNFEIRAKAFQKATEEVFTELIWQGEIEKATVLINQFIKFKTPVVLAIEARIFLNALENNKEEIKLNFTDEDYKENINKIYNDLQSIKSELSSIAGTKEFVQHQLEEDFIKISGLIEEFNYTETEAL